MARAHVGACIVVVTVGRYVGLIGSVVASRIDEQATTNRHLAPRLSAGGCW